jgi:hypothetical protein
MSAATVLADLKRYFGGAWHVNSDAILTYLATPLAQAASSTGIVRAGSYAAVADDATAGTTDIDTGLTSITGAPIVQILRSGVDVKADSVVTWDDGTITVADGGTTYAVTAGDVISWVAVGS